jgi:HK97 gp10 family phage protein
MTISVRINGIEALTRGLGEGLDAAIRPAFKIAAVIVEGSARSKVHKVTRKLATSISHRIEGQGLDISAHIGPQQGSGNLGARSYSVSDTQAWKTPRAGRNTGDPTVYGKFEEEGTRYRKAHPFLEPALTENVGRITNGIAAEISRALERRF